MNLEFDGQKMLLAHYNARSEIHGEEREPVGDLKFEATLENDCLAMVHPTLKSSLYYLDGAREADLADRGKRGEKGYLPHLRFPALAAPIKWEEEMVGAYLRIEPKGGKPIELEAVKVHKLEITPRDFGMVDLAFKASVHPTEPQMGRLCALIQAEVSITLSASDEGKA